MPGVKRERDDSVGVLTLDEPETLNAMTPDLLGDLATAIGEINDDPQVRALVLTGAGRGFCSGQNLKAAQILGDDIAAGVMKYYWPTFKALRECRVPIVVAVNGVAAGGGFSLAMAGDMIVAARSARFIQVFSRIALVPDLGSTWLLPRLVGRQRALELMMTNEPLTADQAREWGLVREVFDARAGRDAPPDRRERTRQLCRSVPPRDRNAGGNPSQRRRGGGAQRFPGKTCGGVHRTLRKDLAI
jgi:2-(1,2-epoxy-1,2-dihydrophenyl)acetyl-CoA isomerase